MYNKTYENSLGFAFDEFVFTGRISSNKELSFERQLESFGAVTNAGHAYVSKTEFQNTSKQTCTKLVFNELSKAARGRIAIFLQGCEFALE